MYAFLSHISACDVLRTLSTANLARWPQEPRELPRHYNTVTTQRMFKAYAQAVDLASYGVTRSPVDLLVPRASQRSRGSTATFHLWKRDIPANAFFRLDETLFSSSPEFVLLQLVGWHSRIRPIARSFSQELKNAQDAQASANIDAPVPYDDPFAWDYAERILEVVLIAMEFMGTYRRAIPDGSTKYHQPQILTHGSVNQFLASLSGVYGRNRLESVLSLSLPHSASPMETALALMLSLPESYGGYALSRPKLNRSIPVKTHEALWSGGPSITPDFYWPEINLAVEYDSDEAHGSAGSRKLADDATRANVLASLGYKVLRVTTLNIQSIADVDRLAHSIASLLGVEMPAQSETLRIRRNKLHALLMRH